MTFREGHRERPHRWLEGWRNRNTCAAEKFQLDWSITWIGNVCGITFIGPFQTLRLNLTRRITAGFCCWALLIVLLRSSSSKFVAGQNVDSILDLFLGCISDLWIHCAVFVISRIDRSRATWTLRSARIENGRQLHTASWVTGWSSKWWVRQDQRRSVTYCHIYLRTFSSMTRRSTSVLKELMLNWKNTITVQTVVNPTRHGKTTRDPVPTRRRRLRDYWRKCDENFITSVKWPSADFASRSSGRTYTKVRVHW